MSDTCGDDRVVVETVRCLRLPELVVSEDLHLDLTAVECELEGPFREGLPHLAEHHRARPLVSPPAQ